MCCASGRGSMALERVPSPPSPAPTSDGVKNFFSDTLAGGQQFRNRTVADYATRERFLIESFNGRLPAECLNGHWFRDLADANAIIPRSVAIRLQCATALRAVGRTNHGWVRGVPAGAATGGTVVIHQRLTEVLDQQLVSGQRLLVL